jgi:hypothetical protein
MNREVEMQRRTLWSRALASLVVATAMGPAAPASVAATQPEPGMDNLWEVTIKTESAGTSMQTPAQTDRVCLAKGTKDENYIPRREECKLADSKRTGNTIDYKMVCAGKDPMIIAGDITTSPKSYEGKMRMTGIRNGENMDMTQTFSGKLVGECASSK